MAIIARASDGQTFTPAPEGTHQGVCVDIIDKGEMPNAFKPGTTQHKIAIAWQINETRDDGKRYLVYKRYTLSLGDLATLRHDLESWRGKPFTEEERRGFDVEKLLGANALLNIQHRKSADGLKTYANVMAVTPLMKGMGKMSPADGYVREQDRTEGADAAPGEPVELDDVPF